MTENPARNIAIYSFKAKWLEPLRAGQVGIFFRKRAPARTPSQVLLYVGAPISAIVGSAKVLSMERLLPEAALDLAPKGAIDRRELDIYLVGAGSVTGIYISQPRFYSHPLSIRDVQSVMNFYPPQNFMQIDNETAAELEQLAQ